MSRRRILLFAMALAIVSAMVSFGIRRSAFAVAIWPALQEPAGDLDVQLSVSPQNTAPGSEVSLTVLVLNSRSEDASPEILISLSDYLTFDESTFPSGTFLNLQTNTLSWQPIVPGSNGTAQLLLRLAVNVADLRQPEQTITVTLKEKFQERIFTSQVWVGVLPQAMILFDPPQAAVGQPVQLKAVTSGPGPFTQLWSLGDGRNVEAQDPVVVFPNQGTFEITLHLANPLGAVQVSGAIQIVAQPTAQFTPDDITPGVGQAVAFANQSGGQTPLTYYWDFNDGAYSRDAEPIHQFPAPGVFQVKLVVENEYGRAETVMPVTVGVPPLADALISEVALAGQVVTGEAFADGPEITVHWDMGDGSAEEGAIINHVFWAAGDYLVTVSIANDYGMAQIFRWVHVEPGALLFYLPMVASPGVGQPALPDSTADQTALHRAEALATQPITLEPLDLAADLSSAEQLFAYINEARRLARLSALTYVYELSVAAQAHTDDMSTFGYTGHVGSDGSSPPLRLRRAGYQGGYGGEATAWGMQDAIDSVQFWLDSPPHRSILLNPLVTEVGIGYSVNFSAPNVWYWTAEFASPDLPLVDIPLPTPTSQPATPEPVLLQLGPPQNSELVLEPANNLIFTWTWSEPLVDGERFIVYLKKGNRIFQIGSVAAPLEDRQYQFKVGVTNVPVSPGAYEWQVRLENSAQGTVLRESPFWGIIFLDSTLATPQPTAAESDPQIPTATSIPRGESFPPTPLPVSTPVPTTAS